MNYSDEQLDQLAATLLLEKSKGNANPTCSADMVLDLIEMAKAFNFRESYKDERLPMDHNDRALYDFKLPAFVRSFIAINSLNATCTCAIDDAGHMPKLYARYQGTPVRVTLVSRLGDVGISKADRRHGYDKRVALRDLDSFSQTPLQPHTEEDGA